MKKTRIIIVMLLVLTGAVSVFSAAPRRRMTPVNNSATMTQSVNETADDTARINAKRRASSISYVNEDGRTIYVDTISGQEWTDSTTLGRVPKMDYPLLHAVHVGLNLWDPLMRAFGQHYGIADVWAELSLHNRYLPVFEFGLGTADYTPSGSNFNYRSPVSPYFKIGANYNFLYNSSPDYYVVAGLRYAFSPFSFSVRDITLNDSYWGESSTFSIPSTHATAGWLEVSFGLRVKLWGPISAGWMLRYQALIHQSRSEYGKPWYIPGYGSRESNFSGSVSVIYTFGLGGLNKRKAQDVLNENVSEPASVPEGRVILPEAVTDSVSITE